MFLNASGLRSPSWYTKSYTAVHRRALALSPTLPTFQVAEGFALPASFSLRCTVPLLATEHFRLLALRCGTACHRRLRRHRLWRPSALDSRRSSSRNHMLTFGWSDILYLHTVHQCFKYLRHSKNSWLTDWLMVSNYSLSLTTLPGGGRLRKSAVTTPMTTVWQHASSLSSSSSHEYY